MDYIVPMPMTVARLQEYVEAYDVSLEHSCAAIDAVEPGLIYGIAMLGVRDNRTWITRMGVLPYARRLGTGRLMMQFLVDETRKLGADELWLEVIQGNEPAHALFVKTGFRQTRELIVSRRPPTADMNGTDCLSIRKHIKLEVGEMLERLNRRHTPPNWLNQTETFQNLKNIAGYRCEFWDGSAGWVIYEPSSIQLKRVIVDVEKGDRALVTHSILFWLHQRHPIFDAISENIPVDDPQWLGYEAMGYFDSFHRIEMVKDMTLDSEGGF